MFEKVAPGPALVNEVNNERLSTTFTIEDRPDTDKNSDTTCSSYRASSLCISPIYAPETLIVYALRDGRRQSDATA